MKLGITKLTLLVLIGALFQNCAPQNFGNSSDGGVGVTSNPQPNDPTPTPGGTPDPTANPLAMRLETPDCNAYSMCPATFKLLHVQTQELRFHWKTNDTKYLVDPTTFAQPDVNYVRAEGDLIFAPGETVKVIQIQSLAFPKDLKIPFKWTDCKMGGQDSACPTVVY